MKKLIAIILLALASQAALATDLGQCKIIGVSDASSDDPSPHVFYTREIETTSLEKCLGQFEKSITYLKDCYVITGSMIRYAEMQFKINNRVLNSVEQLQVLCD